MPFEIVLTTTDNCLSSRKFVFNLKTNSVTESVILAVLLLMLLFYAPKRRTPLPRMRLVCAGQFLYRLRLSYAYHMTRARGGSLGIILVQVCVPVCCILPQSYTWSSKKNDLFIYLIEQNFTYSNIVL